MGALPVRSVLDVGCGQGAWLAAWKEHGVSDSVGMDGDYVDARRLLISARHFLPTDLNKRFNAGRSFDLVQSLEVAEHLPPARAESFVDDLGAHGRVILFSAAVPGQGGENHINERNYEYWRRLFAARGYGVFDVIRPSVLHDKTVEFWYRYNALLYVHESVVKTLPERWQVLRIAAGAPIKDYAPLRLRLRRRLLCLLPASWINRLARAKHAMCGWHARIRDHAHMADNQ